MIALPEGLPMHSRQKTTILRERFSCAIVRFRGDRSGSAMILGALVLPILILVAGMAVDYGSASSSATRLQEMADAAAIAAAKELVLANADQDQLESVAELSIETNFAANPRDVLQSVNVVTMANPSANTITVEISAMHDNAFGGFLNPAQTQIIRRSTAQALSGIKLCVLGLDQSVKGAIKMEDSSQITAEQCAVYSNSSDNQAIQAASGATVTADLICAVGGVGSGASYTPAPLTDCPQVDDPLASRPGPSLSSCDETNFVLAGGTVSLSPGVYCGGIEIKSAANVTFEPGIYIISDGSLQVKDTSTIYGEHVGFYFTGSGSGMNLTRDTSISLTAPKDGELAGLLFFRDQSDASSSATFRIESNDARTLLGTIYLPGAIFRVDASSPVADASAYTVIIAKKFHLQQGPNLVLNSNYADTEVPVPNGIVNHGAKVTLVK